MVTIKEPNYVSNSNFDDFANKDHFDNSPAPSSSSARPAASQLDESGQSVVSFQPPLCLRAPDNLTGEIHVMPTWPALPSGQRLRIEELLSQEQLEEHLRASNTACSVMDAEGNWLAGARPELCQIISATVEGRNLRQAWVSARTRELHDHQEPVVFYSHTNLQELIAPIRIRGWVVGYVRGPHSTTAEGKSHLLAQIHEVFSETSVSETVQALRAAVEHIPILSQEELQRLAGEIQETASLFSHECQLKMLAQVRQRVTVAETPSEIYEQVMSAIDRLFGEPSICLFLMGEDGRLHLCAHRRDPTANEATEQEMGQGHAGWVALYGKELLVPDLDEWGDRDPKFLERDKINPPRSALTVPIEGRRSRTQAVVQVFSTVPQSFHKSDIEILRSLGVSFIDGLQALQSEQMPEQGRRHREPLRLTFRLQKLVYRPIDSGTELATARRELYQMLVDETPKLMHKEKLRSAISILDGPPNQLRFIAVSGPDTEKIKNEVLRVKDPFIPGAQHYIENTTVEEYFKRMLLGTQSVYSLPLRVQRNIVGVLTVSSELKDAFTSGRTAVLERWVARTCGALEHLLLLQETWLYDFERTLPGPKEVKSLCEDSLRHIQRIFGVRACSIFLKEPSSDVLTWTAGTSRLTAEGVTPILADSDQLPTYKLGEGFTGWVAKNRKILRLRNPFDKTELANIARDLSWSNKWPEDINYKETTGCRAYLAAPLLVRDQLVGVLRLTTREDGSEFDLSDEVLIKRVAEPLAVWIDTRWHEGWAQSLEMLAALLGGFQHEIRNVAHHLSSHLAVLQHPKFEASRGSDRMSKMKCEIQRLSNLSTDLAAFARVKQPIPLEMVEVNEMLDKVLSDRREALPSNIKLSVELGQPAPLVRGNSIQLQQAVARLVENAVDAMPSGGHLCVRSAANGRWVEISVEDSGVGMSEEVRLHCLEPFFSTKNGTGLGLWVVSGITKQHSGKVTTDSTPGRGTTVRLTLPKWEVVENAQDSDRG